MCPGEDLIDEKQSRSRRHRLAMAPSGPRSEFVVLDEIGGLLGLTLWERVRDAYLWASVEEDHRVGLFRARRSGTGTRLPDVVDVAPAIVEAIALLGFVSRYPERVTAGIVAQACNDVSTWAAETLRLETAVLFAETAAVAEPEVARHATVAGRLCRRVGNPSRASWWYLRGIGLGRRSKDWDSYVSGQLGYGMILFQFGNASEAKKHYIRGARRAEWAGMDGRAAEAHHDIMTIASDYGTLMEGITAARRALDLYPLSHRRIPYFGADVGYLFIQSAGFSSALPILDAARPRIPPNDRLLISGTTARSCAAVGNASRYDEALEAVLALGARAEDMAASAYAHAAEGARTLGRAALARELATTALRIGERRKEHTPTQHAIRILESLAGNAPSDADHPLAPTSGAQTLSRSLIERLSRIHRID
jgi:hypothetical protein